MRYADIALLLLPAGLLAAWLFGVRGFTRRGATTAVLLLAGLGLLLAVLGHDRGFRGAYVPAHLKAGQIEPGHPASDAR